MSQEETTTEVLEEVQPLRLEILLIKSGLDEEDRAMMKTSYDSIVEEVNKWSSYNETLVVKDENDTTSMDFAKSAANALSTTIKNIEKKRKQLKDKSIKEGRAIDEAAKILKGMVLPLKEDFETKANFAFIENEKRVNKRIEERTLLLKPYDVDPEHYDLGGMTESSWENAFAKIKQGHQEKLEEAERNRLAEEKRIENERLEKEKHDLELARLKKENEEAEELERIKNERITIFQHMGFVYDFEDQSLVWSQEYNGVNYRWTVFLWEIFPTPEESFNDLFFKFKNHVADSLQQISEAKLKETERLRAIAERTKNRMAQAALVGFEVNVFLDRMEWKQNNEVKILLPNEKIKELEDQEWDAMFLYIIDKIKVFNIEQLTAEHEAKLKEEARLKRIEERKNKLVELGFIYAPERNIGFMVYGRLRLVIDAFADLTEEEWEKERNRIYLDFSKEKEWIILQEKTAKEKEKEAELEKERLRVAALSDKQKILELIGSIDNITEPTVSSQYQQRIRDILNEATTSLAKIVKEIDNQNK